MTHTPHPIQPPSPPPMPAQVAPLPPPDPVGGGVTGGMPPDWRQGQYTTGGSPGGVQRHCTYPTEPWGTVGGTTTGGGGSPYVYHGPTSPIPGLIFLFVIGAFILYLALFGDGSQARTDK